jgi:hypothetical protein
MFIGASKENARPAGRLDVVVNNSRASIDIRRTTPNPGVIDTKKATGSFSSMLPSGNYVITAKLDLSSSQKIVNLKSGETKKVEISIGVVGDAEPVSNREARNIIVDTALSFLDRASGNIYRVDQANNEKLIQASRGFSTVQWAGSSYGVGQDTTGQLFRITDNATTIAAPFEYNNKTTFALSPNRSLYVSDGKKLYFSKPEGSSKLLYTSTKQISVMAGSDTFVMLSETQSDSKEGSIIVVDQNGSTKRSDGETYSATWSPSGKLVFLSGGNKNGVFDASLNVVSGLPDSNVNAPAWLDDNTLLYGVNDKLWKYDISSKTSSIITSLGSSGQISQVSPSKDGAYIYMSVQKNNDSGDFSFALSRLGLNNQPRAAGLNRIQLVVPNTVSGCSLGYTNFTHLTITVKNISSSQEACLQSSKTYLQQYGVDLSSLQFSIVAN